MLLAIICFSWISFSMLFIKFSHECACSYFFSFLFFQQFKQLHLHPYLFIYVSTRSNTTLNQQPTVICTTLHHWQSSLKFMRVPLALFKFTQTGDDINSVAGLRNEPKVYSVVYNSLCAHPDDS